jgi:hypothetical protein
MSRLIKVGLDKLKPGVKYSFLTEFLPGIRVEGIFSRVVPSSPTNNEGKPQYIFKDCVSYDKNGRKENRGVINFGNPDLYPHDIFVVAFKQLPDDLNQYINKFGGKSRKTKRRYNKKSKRHRNRKSKKRR